MIFGDAETRSSWVEILHNASISIVNITKNQEYRQLGYSGLKVPSSASAVALSA